MSVIMHASKTADLAARTAAIDPHSSVLVQAPAGSGKTDLLTLRFLALLATVEEPEQVLAITFTRKATAEMRARVLGAFVSAEHGPGVDETPHQLTLRERAAAALAHAHAHHWDLQAQPQRLNIQTIDSLALSIAYEMPLLSRLGGQLNPVDDASALYQLAAERTLAWLGSARESELAAAIAEVLRLRDTSLPDCETLIAGMLATREQWLLLLPEILRRSPDWDQLRTELEAPFRREHEEVLELLHQRLQQHLPELIALALIGAENGAPHFDVLRGIEPIQQLLEATHWQSICKLLLTETDRWRQSIDSKVGFPATTHREEGQRVRALINLFAQDEALLGLLCRTRSLPPAAYSTEEWKIVRSIFTLLRRAIAELHVIFAEQGMIDFAEASIAAHFALSDPAVQMRRDDRVRHILVDEFQDTSRTQYALVRSLLHEWQQDDGRTCFFVGDPMQSIYLFRAAEASLFDRIRRHGLELDGSRIAVVPLTLSTNFRSTPGIVAPLNEVFARVLVEDNADGVGYAAALSSKAAVEDAPAEDNLRMHVQVAPQDQETSDPQLRSAQADAVLRVIQQHLPAIEQARRAGERYRVAVLVRSRTHLPEILMRLRDANIRFRGVKIEPLADRQEILDLLSLLQALLHPADRIAWLSVLRAPWCGLPLPALHAICGDGDASLRDVPIADLLRRNQDRLSAEDRQRALHVLNVLEGAAAAYAEGLLSTTPSALSLWLERTWHALGAPRYVDAQARANAEVFFREVGQIPPGSMGTLDERFNRALSQLFAEPDPATTDECGVQVMTIHGAKGLEFEVVLVPGLEREAPAEKQDLFRWMVRGHDESADQLLLAPIGRKQNDTPALYSWVNRKWTQRLRQEHKRLLYVACSRAIRELHLFAIVSRDTAGALRRASSDTLLGAGWEGLLPRLEAEIVQPSVAHEPAAATCAEPEAAAANVVAMPQLELFTPPINGILLNVAAGAGSRQSLRRLPQSWFRSSPARSAATPDAAMRQALSPRSPLDRLARIRGTVLHALLAHAASLQGDAFADDAGWPQRTAAMLRQHGIAAAELGRLQEAILTALRNTFTDANGRWLLNAASSALNESSWSSMSSGGLQRYRPDRIFRAGDRPGAPGDDYVWIVDYKTASPQLEEDRTGFLARSREQYRAQLESYSDVLRASDKEAAGRQCRLAIYYPALPFLDWWPH